MTRAGPFQGEKQWGHYESHVTISHDGEARVLQEWVPCQKPPVRILREGEVAGAPESPPGPGAATPQGQASLPNTWEQWPQLEKC